MLHSQNDKSSSQWGPCLISVEVVDALPNLGMVSETMLSAPLIASNGGSTKQVTHCPSVLHSVVYRRTALSRQVKARPC